MQNSIDKELVCSVCDTDSVEDFVEVVRDEAVTRPLREEGDGYDDAETLEVTLPREKRLPANVGRDVSVKFNGSLNFFEFILHKRIESSKCSFQPVKQYEMRMAYSFPSA